eukprot:37248-Rhodomonas_salina.1
MFSTLVATSEAASIPLYCARLRNQREKARSRPTLYGVCAGMPLFSPGQTVVLTSAAKSKTQNRIPGTKCTALASSVV